LFIPIRRPSYSPRPPSRRSSDLLQKPLPAPLNSPFGETPVLCREFAWTLRSLQRQEDTGTGRRNLHVRQPFPLSSGQQRRLNRDLPAVDGPLSTPRFRRAGMSRKGGECILQNLASNNFTGLGAGLSSKHQMPPHRP